MGWGCYKHEWDAESINWVASVDALCDRKLAERPRTFGRDRQICPACYEELEAKLEAMERGLEEWHAEMAQAANDPLHFLDERNGIRMTLAAFHRRFPAAQQEK